jgi:peptidoglycan DL-endopeptidase CwlO
MNGLTRAIPLPSCGLDSLSRAVGQNNRIIEQARESRQQLAAVEARLAEQATELDALAAAAEQRVAELAATTAARRSFVASLRQQQGLKAARVAEIEAQARTAEQRSAAISPPTEPLAADSDAILSAPAALAASGPQTITVSSTGYSLRGQTSTGMQTAAGVVAVDPSVIPLGARLTIPGYGTGIAADTGGSVRGNVIDLWLPTLQQARAWGRRTITITIHKR